MHDNDSALDIVQDAMIKLAEKYGDRPPDEFPLIFQRILQNVIRDHFRRQKVRNTWNILLSAFSFGEADDEVDPLDILATDDARQAFGTPHDNLAQAQTLSIIEAEVKKLPPRQREAFLLRYWEDMDISETAAIMGCTEGSVKTHCFRATQTLAAALQIKQIKP